MGVIVLISSFQRFIVIGSLITAHKWLFFQVPVVESGCLRGRGEQNLKKKAPTVKTKPKNKQTKTTLDQACLVVQSSYGQKLCVIGEIKSRNTNLTSTNMLGKSKSVLVFVCLF